jgi:hypothetical protein
VANPSYDHGLTPTVAWTGQAVVEVHQSETNFNLFYHVGTIQSNNQIDWGPTRGPYDHGRSAGRRSGWPSGWPKGH